MLLVVLQGFYSSPALCTCTSESAASLAHLAHFVPTDPHDRDKNPLSNALAPFPSHRLFAEIENLRLQFIPLSAIILVDDTHPVWDEQSLTAWCAAPHTKQQHIAVRDAHNHIAWNKFYRTWFNLCIFTTEQVKAHRPCRSIDGQR